MSKSMPIWPYLAFNSDGERLEVYPDLVINLEYWDCECKHDYIRALDNVACERCGQTRESSPSSHENEVREQIKNACAQPGINEHNAKQALLLKSGGV